MSDDDRVTREERNDLERERDEALAGVEAGRRAAQTCREVTDALIRVRAILAAHVGCRPDDLDLDDLEAEHE